MGLIYTEHTPVCSPNPSSGAVLGNRYIVMLGRGNRHAPDGDVPRRTYTIMDTSTGQSLVYSFDGVNNYSAGGYGAWVYDGSVWCITTTLDYEGVGISFNRIESNGTYTEYVTPYSTNVTVGDAPRFNIIGDHAWLGLGDDIHRFHIPTGTWASSLSGSGIGEHLWTPTSGSYYRLQYGGGSTSNLYRLDTSTGADIAAGVASHTGTILPAPSESTGLFVEGATWWWAYASALFRFNTSTLQVAEWSTPYISGTPVTRRPCRGPDGLIYTPSRAALHVLDSSDGSALSETIPNRLERTSAWSVGGKVWIPAGQPY